MEELVLTVMEEVSFLVSKKHWQLNTVYNTLKMTHINYTLTLRHHKIAHLESCGVSAVYLLVTYSCHLWYYSPYLYLYYTTYITPPQIHGPYNVGNHYTEVPLYLYSVNNKLSAQLHCMLQQPAQMMQALLV